MEISFKSAQPDDIDYIKNVYNYYVTHTTATFHLEPVSLEHMQNSLPMNHALYHTWIIYWNKKPCGYCYIGNWKPREAYNRSSELTLYLENGMHGKGIGKQTLEFIEKEAKTRGIKNLLGVITAENIASINLFEKMAYKKVGHLKNIGEKFGRLLDVLTYQKQL
jgi:phosphinothricin acetyltransferase